MRFLGHKYTYTNFDWCYPPRTHHSWELRGPTGGIKFHVLIVKDGEPLPELEVHYSSPPDCMKECAPHHTNCPLIGGRCWHDGMFLYASETLWPMIEAMLVDGDHDAIFKVLEGEYDTRFNDKAGEH